MTRCSGFVAAAFGLLLGGSAAARPEAVAAQRAAVIGGVASRPEDDAVVRVLVPVSASTARMCHGALIAPNVVATQLSCVSYFTETAPFQCTPEGALAPPDLGNGWIGAPLQPDQIEVFFGADLEEGARATAVFGSGSTQACVDNIAFLVLDRGFPSHGFPVRLGRPVSEGELMTVIGWGGLVAANTGRSRRSNVPVVAVGPEDTSQAIGIAAPRTFLLGEGPCAGDAGSPALSDETGALTGIFSVSMFLSPSDCRGGLVTYVQIAPYESLLRRAFEAAGAEPQIEGEAPPGDESSSGCSLHGSAEPRWLPPFGLALAALVRRRRSRREDR